ncbi:hypothetical protein MRS44_018038 [Fusarium solani]|uniref:uncharacterized protein n=1 Tax=Fusarium solani TaxID=169388 RepID=UPI0032C4620C|nr:hypothetical protein MRS44_018038 [Fusarium solani]
MLQTKTIFISSLIGVCCAGTTFRVPASGGADKVKLDAAPVALSFEFTEFANYFLNYGNTKPCMSNLKQLTGVWPRIRIGGTSQDESLYDANLDEPIIKQGSGFVFGPSLLKIAGEYEGAIVLGLNRGGNNMTNTIEATDAAQDLIPNLIVVFPYFQFPIVDEYDTWNHTTEAASESRWQIGVGEATKSNKFVQAGNYVTMNYTAETLFEGLGPAALKYVRTFSHHNYPQTVANTTTFPPVNLKSLMSHVQISGNVGSYATDTQVTRELGLEWVFGETNSVSGGGSPEISKTFGAALWVLDYALRAASVNVVRAYFHHGSYDTCFYPWWTPFGVTSPYYGGYVATKAMAGGAYISALDDGTSNYAGYTIYSAAGKPIKAVLINSDYYDGTGMRAVRTFELQGLLGRTIGATRLTATSALSRQDEGDAPTFGGQVFSDETCQLQNQAVKERVKVSNGVAKFKLASSEALLLDL